MSQKSLLTLDPKPERLLTRARRANRAMANGEEMAALKRRIDELTIAHEATQIQLAATRPRNTTLKAEKELLPKSAADYMKSPVKTVVSPLVLP